MGSHPDACLKAYLVESCARLLEYNNGDNQALRDRAIV